MFSSKMSEPALHPSKRVLFAQLKLVCFRNDGGTRDDLLHSSRDIVRACEMVSRLTKQLAMECTDKHNQAVSSHNPVTLPQQERRNEHVLLLQLLQSL